MKSLAIVLGGLLALFVVGAIWAGIGAFILVLANVSLGSAAIPLTLGKSMALGAILFIMAGIFK